MIAEKICPSRNGSDAAQDISSQIKKRYDRCAGSYDADTGLQRHLAAMLAGRMREFGLLPCRILDIGCGTGYLAGELRKIAAGGIFLTGCDLSFGMLIRAKNKTFHSYDYFLQADACSLPFSDSQFDCVVSNAAYQWVSDSGRAFRQVRSVLKPKGIFYFTVFGKNTLWQLQQICEETGIIKPASSNFMDEAAFAGALKKSGFNDVNIEALYYEKYYRDLWELLGILKNMGATAAENRTICGLGWRKILRRINDLYCSKFGGTKGIPAGYEVFLIRAA